MIKRTTTLRVIIEGKLYGSYFSSRFDEARYETYFSDINEKELLDNITNILKTSSIDSLCFQLEDCDGKRVRYSSFYVGYDYFEKWEYNENIRENESTLNIKPIQKTDKWIKPQHSKQFKDVLKKELNSFVSELNYTHEKRTIELLKEKAS